MHLWTLASLPGVKRAIVKAAPAPTRTAALRLLSRHRATSWAGDHGAINVWRDDAGAYRTAFCRRMITVDEQTHATKASVAAWLRVWWPRMSR